jgi:hypothetical protein
MTALNCTYLDGAYSATLNAGKPGDTLREILQRAKSQGERLGYGVLKVDDKVKSLVDLDTPIGEATRIEFLEVERIQTIDLDSI